MKSQYLITLVIILILAIKFFVLDKIKNQYTTIRVKGIRMRMKGK